MRQEKEGKEERKNGEVSRERDTRYIRGASLSFLVLLACLDDRSYHIIGRYCTVCTVGTVGAVSVSRYVHPRAVPTEKNACWILVRYQVDASLEWANDDSWRYRSMLDRTGLDWTGLDRKWRLEADG